METTAARLRGGEALLSEMTFAFDHDEAMDEAHFYEDLDGGASLEEEEEEEAQMRSTTESMTSPCGVGEGLLRAQVNMEISPTRRKAAQDPKKKSVAKKKKGGVGTGEVGDDHQQEEEATTIAKRKQASIDQRRKRNREAMQRARQRDKVCISGVLLLGCMVSWVHSSPCLAFLCWAL